MSEKGIGKTLRKVLAAGGCVLIRQGKGSHYIWRAPNGKLLSVPLNPARHTANGILKEAGLPKAF